MTFQQETIAAWWQDAPALVRAHWEELGLDLDLEISPDVSKMALMQELGMFKVLTAREEGKLCGYLLAVFSAHLHYSTSKPMFIVDAYYIAPNFRHGTGTKLLKFAEHVAKELGAIKMYLSCKVHEDHSALFTRLGYRLSDYAFIKRI